MSYKNLINMMADDIIKTAAEDVPSIMYDRKTGSPYVDAYPEDAYYDEDGRFVGDDGTEYDEDGYPVSVDDVISPEIAQQYRRANNMETGGALGMIGGSLAGGIGGTALGVKGAGKLLDHMIEHEPHGASLPRRLGRGFVGGAAASGLLGAGLVGGSMAGGAPGFFLAGHGYRNIRDLNNQLTPEQVEALRQRAIISKQAGYDVYESVMEKEAFAGAAVGAVKATLPKVVNGLKNIGGLAKAQGDLMKTKATAPGVQKAMQQKGIMGDFQGSAIAQAKGNRDAAFQLAKPALKNVGIIGSGLAVGDMLGNMNQNKAAGAEAYYALMEKSAKITRDDKARFNNIKALGADFDPAPVTPTKKVSITQPIRKIKPAVTNAVEKMPKVPRKGALGALGLGAALGTGTVMGASHLMKNQDPAFKQAAEAYIDGLIQKQAALETMAESKLIAEASEKAVNSYGYSMFA